MAGAQVEALFLLCLSDLVETESNPLQTLNMEKEEMFSSELHRNCRMLLKWSIFIHVTFLGNFFVKRFVS